MKTRNHVLLIIRCLLPVPWKHLMSIWCITEVRQLWCQLTFCRDTFPSTSSSWNIRCCHPIPEQSFPQVQACRAHNLRQRTMLQVWKVPRFLQRVWYKKHHTKSPLPRRQWPSCVSHSHSGPNANEIQIWSAADHAYHSLSRHIGQQRSPDKLFFNRRVNSHLGLMYQPITVL